MKKLLIFLFPIMALAQNDLLESISTPDADKSVGSAFKSLKIVNLETTKLAAKGDLYFVVAHRFDYVNNGFDDFFGLDNANTQIKFLYGISEWLTVQVARSGFQETYDAAVKYRLVEQKVGGFPVTIAGFSSLAINSELKKENFPNLQFADRLSFVNQIIISRKFSERLSLLVSPTYFHENTVRDIVDENGMIVVDKKQDNSQYAIGLGGRFKLTNRWALNIDYAAHLNRSAASLYKNPLSIGFDLETGGHIFQMHFTNARAMHEAGFLGQTTGRWNKGEIAFGFNLVRVF